MPDLSVEVRGRQFVIKKPNAGLEVTYYKIGASPYRRPTFLWISTRRNLGFWCRFGTQLSLKRKNSIGFSLSSRKRLGAWCDIDLN